MSVREYQALERPGGAAPDLRIERLKRENQALRDRIEELEGALGVALPQPVQWPGSPTQWRLFSLIVKRGAVGREQMMAALYGHRDVDRRPDPKMLDVFMSRIRGIVTPAGIVINTIWGHGWALTADMKTRAGNLVERLQRGEAL